MLEMMLSLEIVAAAAILFFGFATLHGRSEQNA